MIKLLRCAISQWAYQMADSQDHYYGTEQATGWGLEPLAGSRRPRQWGNPVTEAQELSLHGRLILVVEDDPIIAMGLRSLLEDTGGCDCRSRE